MSLHPLMAPLCDTVESEVRNAKVQSEIAILVFIEFEVFF